MANVLLLLPTPLPPLQLLGLFLLVCFGSCMDIAAIQQDSPKRLDTNRELACIGGCAVPF